MVLVGARVIRRLRHAARQIRRTSEALQQVSEKTPQLNVLVVGVNRLTEAYIQALAELGMGRVKVAGIVGCAHRHAEGSLPVIQCWGRLKTSKVFLMDLMFMVSPSTALLSRCHSNNCRAKWWNHFCLWSSRAASLSSS
jgi:hypothetical protein